MLFSSLRLTEQKPIEARFVLRDDTIQMLYFSVCCLDYKYGLHPIISHENCIIDTVDNRPYCNYISYVSTILEVLLDRSLSFTVASSLMYNGTLARNINSLVNNDLNTVLPKWNIFTTENLKFGTVPYETSRLFLTYFEPYGIWNWDRNQCFHRSYDLVHVMSRYVRVCVNDTSFSSTC